VTVTVTDGGSSNDTLTVSSPTCTFHLGTIDLRATGYATGGNLTLFGTGGSKSEITWIANTGALMISLGAQIGRGHSGECQLQRRHAESGLRREGRGRQPDDRPVLDRQHQAVLSHHRCVA